MSVQGQNSAYRRGVILGLTMAEIVILIIFLLLLIFSALLKRANDQHIKELSYIQQHKDDVTQIIQVLEQEEPDISEELVRGVPKMPNIIKLIKENELADKDETAIDVINRAIDKLKQQKDLKAQENPSTASLSPEERLEQVLLENKDLEAQVKDIKGQNTNLMKQSLAAGNGLQYPPCWPEKGEYIFSVNLTSQGIIIHDNKLPQRVDQQSKLPIQQIVFDKELGPVTFSKLTYPLLKWSRDHDCRFIVTVRDSTGSGQKQLYKNLLRTVEGSFYKVEIR